MKENLRLMVVDDSPIDRLLLEKELAEVFPDASLRVVGASKKEFLATLEEPDAIWSWPTIRSDGQTVSRSCTACASAGRSAGQFSSR